MIFSILIEITILLFTECALSHYPKTVRAGLRQSISWKLSKLNAGMSAKMDLMEWAGFDQIQFESLRKPKNSVCKFLICFHHFILHSDILFTFYFFITGSPGTGSFCILLLLAFNVFMYYVNIFSMPLSLVLFEN